MGSPIRIVYCDCSRAEIIPPEVKRQVLIELSGAGVVFESVSDLCGLCADKDTGLQRIAEAREVRIAACYPRAVKWLFHAAGAPLNGARVRVVNMRELGAAEVVANLISDLPEDGDVQGGSEFANAEADGWIPWFPVIDYDRCENCKQCLGFCLFGVYAVDEDGRVEVRNPDQCKTGCPACARVCPSAAIIFPKYDKRPVNGDEVRDEDLAREPVKVDVAALAAGNVHETLRARSRKAKEQAPGAADPAAAAERLTRLQAELDIPDEVIRNLSGGGACESAEGQAPPGLCKCQLRLRAGRPPEQGSDGAAG
jgi:NAD-dependent dihydropyrimidine dehydrogenase PreA subunit